jgi:hypothetical protein
LSEFLLPGQHDLFSSSVTPLTHHPEFDHDSFNLPAIPVNTADKSLAIVTVAEIFTNSTHHNSDQPIEISQTDLQELNFSPLEQLDNFLVTSSSRLVKKHAAQKIGFFFNLAVIKKITKLFFRIESAEAKKISQTIEEMHLSLPPMVRSNYPTEYQGQWYYQDRSQSRSVTENLSISLRKIKVKIVGVQSRN